MPKKTKFGFGKSSNVEQAVKDGKINARDIVFLDEDTDNPKVGWVTLDGEVVLAKPDLSEVESDIVNLETAIAGKADAETVTTLENELTTKATIKQVMELETVLDSKVDAIEVDEKLEAALGEYLAKKYEVSHKPEGTLVNYRDKEIRIMIPASTQFELQNSGENADPNMYYIGFRAYSPDTAVSFKEDTQKTITDDTMYYFEGNDFAGVDENGRKYSIVWLPVASYDGSTWTYYGANSSESKYIGWYYSVQWFDANGVVIASDCIRINLSNEKCHSSIEPYYVGDIMKEVDTKIETAIEEKLVEIDAGYEIVELD